jgi:hypothetical protein
MYCESRRPARVLTSNGDGGEVAIEVEVEDFCRKYLDFRVIVGCSLLVVVVEWDERGPPFTVAPAAPRPSTAFTPRDQEGVR